MSELEYAYMLLYADEELTVKQRTDIFVDIESRREKIGATKEQLCRASHVLFKRVRCYFSGYVIPHKEDLRKFADGILEIESSIQ